LAIEIAPRIVVDATIRFGKPVIKGTRVPAYLVVAKLGSGMPIEEVAAEYGIEIADIHAVLAYAATVLESEEIRAIH
jgi:uncharacterized protein (DUF433 family)